MAAMRERIRGVDDEKPERIEEIVEDTLAFIEASSAGVHTPECKAGLSLAQLLRDKPALSLPKCASMPMCCQEDELPPRPWLGKEDNGNGLAPRLWLGKEDNGLGGGGKMKRVASDRCFHDLVKFVNLQHFAQSPMAQSKLVRTTSSPYLSPLLAPDELLQGLRQVHLIACELDPMLDDSVMFARRLRAIGRPVTLDILPDLPHGFLNFVLISPEAQAGADRCVAAIRSILSLADKKSQYVMDHNAGHVVNQNSVVVPTTSLTSSLTSSLTGMCGSLVSPITKVMSPITRQLSSVLVSAITPVLGRRS